MDVNQLLLDTIKKCGSIKTNSINEIEELVDTGLEKNEDNIYKGITPVTYQKIAGTHTLTFRKQGYVTTSYTIVVNDDGLDQSFSFPDLERDYDYNSVSGNSLNPYSKDLNGNSVSGNSVSGNSVSGNSVSQNRIE